MFKPFLPSDVKRFHSKNGNLNSPLPLELAKLLKKPFQNGFHMLSFFKEDVIEGKIGLFIGDLSWKA